MLRENINIDIPGLHFDNRQTDAGLSLNLPDNGGNLLLQGAYNMAQGAYALNINMTDIDLNQTLPLVQDYMNIKQLDALLSGHLKANGRLDDAANIHIAGYLSVDGIDIRDADRQTFLAAEHIGIKIEQFNPKNMLMRFDSILVDSLHLNYIKTKNYDTFSRLMKSSEKQKTQTIDENEDIMLEAEELESDSSISVPQKKNNLPDLFIKQLSLRSSDIHYEDRTLPSRFKYDISHVSVRSENFNMRGKQNHLLINAHLPNGGSVMANWKGGIDPERDNIKVVAMLRNVQLRDLSPYMEYMFAYPVNSGSLSVTSDNTFISGRLEGTTKLDILDLKLGRKKHIDAQLKRVPLKTAIELLTDLNGKISLSIPLFGNVNNPKFSLRKVVMGTLGNVLLKATATPFAAMARSKNIKIDDLSLLEIDMLTPDFTLEQYQKIDLLAEMMNEKQEINLQMVQQFNLQKAMAELAVFNLKRDYYLQEHPSIDGTKRLSLVEIEKVRSIKDGDAGFTAYYKSVCAGKGKLSDRALNYYTPDSVKTEVLRKAQIRNNILTRYLTQQKNINKKRVSIRTADDATLVVYKGKEKYSIESTLE